MTITTSFATVMVGVSQISIEVYMDAVVVAGTLASIVNTRIHVSLNLAKMVALAMFAIMVGVYSNTTVSARMVMAEINVKFLKTLV